MTKFFSGAAAVILLAAFLAPAAAIAGKGEAARIEAEYGEIGKNIQPRPTQTPEGANWWLYNVTLREKTGRIGVTLESWQKCYQGVGIMVCDPRRRNIKELFGTDRLPPGGMIRLRRPAWVWAEPTGNYYKVRGTYYGRDDKGNKVKAVYRFGVTSK